MVLFGLSTALLVGYLMKCHTVRSIFQSFWHLFSEVSLKSLLWTSYRLATIGPHEWLSRTEYVAFLRSRPFGPHLVFGSHFNPSLSDDKNQYLTLPLLPPRQAPLESTDPPSVVYRTTISRRPSCLETSKMTVESSRRRSLN